jgi:hypothetical protein
MVVCLLSLAPALGLLNGLTLSLSLTPHFFPCLHFCWREFSAFAHSVRLPQTFTGFKWWTT